MATDDGWYSTSISGEPVHYFKDGHSICGTVHSKLHSINGQKPDIGKIPKCKTCLNLATN